jgi:hypothetical protein
MTLNQALAEFDDQLLDIKAACEDNIRHIIETTPRTLVSEQKYWANRVSETIGESVEDDVYRLKLKQKLAPLQQVHRRVVGRLQHVHNPKRVGITEEMITRAREYPITELYTELTGNRVGKGNVTCPFHKDTNPSMSLKKHNRYKCFSCDEGGDTIDLYMKLNECRFVDAVKALQ